MRTVYPLPQVIDPPRTCVQVNIPDEPGHRRAFMGAIFNLARWYSWERDSLHKGKAVADVWLQVFEDMMSTFYDGCCEPEPPPTLEGCMHYVGEVFMSASPSAPTGCLPCDGAGYLRTDYPELYAAIDPNLRFDADHFLTPRLNNGRTPIGAGTITINNEVPPGSVTLDAGDEHGAAYTVLAVNQMPLHNHQFQTSSGATAGDKVIQYSTPRQTVAGTYETLNAGGNKSHPNYQPSTALYFYIQAVDCQQSAGQDFDVKLEECNLLKTEDGTSWAVVPGWETLRECLDIPEPFHLRFNDCNLQFSRGSSEWANVPGWSNLSECLNIPTMPDMDMKVENCTLKYSQDGGANWYDVEGWNDLFACFSTDRNADWVCRAAKSHAKELCDVMTAVGATYYTYAQLGYGLTKIEVGIVWPFGEGTRFDTLFDALWNMDDTERHAVFDALQVEDNQKFLASDMYYSFEAGSTGDWTYNGIENLHFNYALCATRPSWEKFAISWFRGAYYDDERGFDAWWWAAMAHVPEWGCYELGDYACEPETYCYHWDFTVGHGAWETYQGAYGLAGSWCAEGHCSRIVEPLDLMYNTILLAHTGYTNAVLRTRFTWEQVPAPVWSVYVKIVGGTYIILQQAYEATDTEIEVALPANTIEIYIGAANNNPSTPPDAKTVILYAEIADEGQSPFGQSNC